MKPIIKSQFFEMLVIIIAALLTLFFIFIDLSTKQLNFVVNVCIGLSVLLLSRVYSNNQGHRVSRFEILSLLFISSWVVFLIIIATGGFFSPLLILMHLYGLAIGLIYTPILALCFVLLGLSVFFSHVMLNSVVQNILFNDFGSGLLYLVSILVVVPLSLYLQKMYHLKDKILYFLKHQLYLGKLQQMSLLKNLKESVIIADKDCRILSVSETVKDLLAISQSEIIGKTIFDVLFLRDEGGRDIGLNTLSLDRLLLVKDSVVFSNLFLYIKNENVPRKVDLLIQPIIDVGGEIDQFTFILTEAGKKDLGGDYNSLESVQLKYKALIADIKYHLYNRQIVDLALKTEFLERIEQDMIDFLILHSYLVIQSSSRVDIGNLSNKIFLKEKKLADLLKTDMQFHILNMSEEQVTRFVPEQARINPVDLTPAFFMANVDVKWIEFILRKLLDFCLILVAGESNSVVRLVIDHQDSKFLVLRIIAQAPSLTKIDRSSLFLPYFKNPGKFNFGSGLEGSLAKTVADKLNIPLMIEEGGATNELVFKLLIAK